MNGIPTGGNLYDKDRAIDKEPTAKLCSLKWGLISFQNQVFLEKPRATSSAFPSPSIPVPSDSSACESQHYLLPSPKKPNHRSKEIKCGFWRSRCSSCQPGQTRGVPALKKMTMPMWQQTKAHGDQGLQPQFCSQALLHHPAHGYSWTHSSCSHAHLILGHSHLDTHRMIAKACPHQWFWQFAADPGPPSSSLGGPSLTQNDVC